MNKILAVLTLTFLTGSSAVFANSTIALPVPSNNVVAAHSTLDLDLNSLDVNVPYVVSCNVESSSPETLDMHVAQQLAPKGGFGIAKVNDKSVVKEVGTFQSGQNTFSFMASVGSNKNVVNKMVLKNLDNRYSATVKSCQAQPASNSTLAANKVGGGYFYVTNDFGYYLDITVGAYFPDGYCIPPYSRAYITVSTPYQDIEIVRTHY
jgi:hypothetical protein